MNKLTQLQIIGIDSIISAWSSYMGLDFATTADSKTVSFYTYTLLPRELEEKDDQNNPYWLASITIDNKMQLHINYNTVVYNEKEEKETIAKMAEAINNFINLKIQSIENMVKEQEEKEKQEAKTQPSNQQEEQPNDVASKDLP